MRHPHIVPRTLSALRIQCNLSDTCVRALVGVLSKYLPSVVGGYLLAECVRVNITVLTAGTRGDVQPYVAVGLGLQTKGHRVRIATHRNFKPMVERYGLEFFRWRGILVAF